MKKPPLIWFALGISAFFTFILALTHPSTSIISFDEGFHGGAGLYLHELVLYLFHHKIGSSPTYLYNEFANGVTLYPLLWAGTATMLGFIFGPTIAIFRATTSLFYFLSLIVTYWFVTKSTKQPLAGLMATVVLATIPMVMIYSHLMMLEVPLLLGVMAMIVSYYAVTMDLVKRNWQTFLLTTLVFAFAPLTKLPALPVTWTIIIVFSILASLFYYRQRFYRHFLKPEILVWFLVSVGMLIANITAIKHFYHVDMLGFFVQQSQTQSQQNNSTSHIIQILTLAWNNREFYLRDFRHIPLLSFIWAGSVVGYLIWKRSPLALLLICWTIITYAAFSGVLPQVPQYIMPIYVPLAIAPALIIYEVGHYFKKIRIRQMLYLGLTLLLVGIQLLALPKSEGYGWRSQQTGYIQAASYVANHSHRGDRVVAWYDGAILAVREQGLTNQLQIIHGGPEVCPEALKDSVDWAIVTDIPPYVSPSEKEILTHAPWQLIASYGNNQTTLLYHNSQSDQWPTSLEVESFSASETIEDPTASQGKALRLTEKLSQPSYWGCLRLMPYGKSRADFIIKPITIGTSIPDNQNVIGLQFTGYPGGELVKRTITAGELRQTHGYGAFPLIFDHERINLRNEFHLDIYQPVVIQFDKIVITPQP